MGVRAIGVIILLVLGLLLGFGKPAIASIHTYPEGAEQVMVRSLQTLRDQRDQAWQLALFKRVNMGRVTNLHLRLVGFPGGAELRHPAPLKIASRDRGWMAADVLGLASPFPATVGEYDVMEVLSQLGDSTLLEMELPLQTGDIALTVPPFVVKEWRQLVA